MYAHWVYHDSFDQLLDVRLHSRAEHELARLCTIDDVRQHGVDLLLEPHLEHLVSFVEHDLLKSDFVFELLCEHGKFEWGTD